MNKDVWYRIFEGWCKDYWSIEQLEKAGILNEDEPYELRNRLLKEIIETIDGEIKDE